MLSLHLEPGDKLERHLEVAGRALASLIEEATDKGLLRISAYPHAGAIVAAALAFSHIHRLGVQVVFRVSIRPPASITVPTLLFGYPSLPYRASDVAARLVSFTPAEFNRGNPPLGSVYIGVDGSMASGYLLAVETAGLGGLSRSTKALALSGIYLDGNVSKSGRIGGIDRVLVERAGEKGGLTLRVVTTLKVYKPHTLPLCESIPATASPPFPLLAGHREECIERLSALGMRHSASKPASALEAKEIEAIVDELIEISEGEVDSANFVSGSLVVDGVRPEDPREAAHAIVYAMESLEDYAATLAAFVDEEVEYPALEARLEASAPRLASLAGGTRPARARGPGWLRVYTVSAVLESPTLAYWNLSSLGLIGEDTVIALPSERGLLVSPLQASLVDYTLPRRLVESKAAKEEDFWLVIEEQE